MRLEILVWMPVKFTCMVAVGDSDSPTSGRLHLPLAPNLTVTLFILTLRVSFSTVTLSFEIFFILLL